MERRTFIKTVVGASLAAEISQAQPSAPDRKLGWALVGLGSLSTNQIAPALLKTKFSQLAAVVTGTPAHRHTGTPAHRHTGTPAHRHTGKGREMAGEIRPDRKAGL